jgi:hypothetical protein
MGGMGMGRTDTLATSEQCGVLYGCFFWDETTCGRRHCHDVVCTIGSSSRQLYDVHVLLVISIQVYWRFSGPQYWSIFFPVACGFVATGSFSRCQMHNGPTRHTKPWQI